MFLQPADNALSAGGVDMTFGQSVGTLPKDVNESAIEKLLCSSRPIESAPFKGTDRPRAGPATAISNRDALTAWSGSTHSRNVR